METIFISYSHKDEDWKERIVTHLKVLALEGHLETWDDRRIGGGEDWYAAIMQAIEKGGVAVLLVSANSLTSEFIRKEEVPRLLALRDAGKLRRLIPLVIKPCPWQAVDWLRKMNLRPRDGQPLSSMSEAEADAAMAAFAMEVFKLTNK
jgi:TIR domain